MTRPLHHRHVVVIAKAPRMGRVKTRLAADIGSLAALRFYRLTVAKTLRRLAVDGRWRLWLALTPDGVTAPACWCASQASILPQGRGDLGDRMARALRADPKRPGGVVVVGGDIPDITPAHIWRAFEELSRSDYVFGPATDGGYWLVGARDAARARAFAPLHPRLFRHVRWSSADALTDTLANVRAGETVGIADTLSDVDRGVDMDRGEQA